MQLLLILVKVNKEIKIVVASHKKRKQVKSNKQALSEVASSLKVMAEISLLRDFKVMAEEDKRRERRYMAFQREEAEIIKSMNCALLKYLREQHNLHPPPNFGFSYFLISHTSTLKGSYRLYRFIKVHKDSKTSKS